ncbi:hypothetical protein LTR17_001162 [Elasticomyces elasticus]|nr:hypothetical protein LTR17_001162 [Elasticomyces elasticus]
MAETPCSRVFGTVELLENVLFQLDMRTLLLSQRVSRTFEATITGSTQLQQKLFFTSVPADTSYRCLEEGCNDLICIGYPPDRLPGHTHQNPLFSHELPHAEAVKGEATMSIHGDGMFVLCDRGLFGPTATTLEYGSWRRMVPCQPAMRVKWGVFSKHRRQHITCGYSSTTMDDQNTVERLVERLWVKGGKEQECGGGAHFFYAFDMVSGIMLN